MWRAVHLFRRHVNHSAFTRIAVELIDSGNIERARKLCRAAPDAALVAMTSRAIDATARLDAELGRSIVRETIRATMVAELSARSEITRRLSWSGPAAVVLGIVAAVIAMSTPSQSLAIVVAGLGVGCGV
jgi:hypothetical protein